MPKRLHPLDIWSDFHSATPSEIIREKVLLAKEKTFHLNHPRISMLECTANNHVVRALQPQDMICPDYIYFEIDEASVLGNSIYITKDRFFHEKLTNKTNLWFWGAAQNDLKHQTDGSYTSLRLDQASAYYKGRTMVLSSAGGGHNYHHWLVDCLPKLHILKSLAITVDRILYPVQTPEKHLQILSLFGIDSGLLQSYDPSGRGVAVCERLVFPGPLSILNEWVRPELTSFMRGVVSSLRKGKCDRYIYLSRLDASNSVRHLQNETELASRLQEAGFEIVKMSDLTFTSQVELVASAKVIVGVHGAAMANLIFASPSCRVLLVEHEHKGYLFYRHLAAHIGFDYNMVAGSTFANPVSKTPMQNQDWVVDVDRVLDVACELKRGV